MAVDLGKGIVTVTANLAPLRTALVSARYQLASFVAGTRSISQVAGFLTGNFLVSGVMALQRAFLGAGQSAASMGETINKLKVIFGASSVELRKFADEIENTFGYAQAEILDAASAFGAMGRGAGMASNDAAKFAKEMVKLAIDMRSVENVSFGTAVQKLQSGLAGQIKPLREYGILLSADQIKQEAYRLGLARTGQALSEKAKVIARASLEFKKAAFVEGDAMATINSTRNLQVAALGRLQNAYTRFGEAIQPIFHGMAVALNDVSKALSSFVKDNKAGIFQWAASVGEGFSFLKEQFRGLIDAIRPAVEEFFVVLSRLWNKVSQGTAFTDVLAFGFKALANSIEPVIRLFTKFLQLIEKISDAITLMTDLISLDFDKYRKDLDDIRRLGHIDVGVPNVPVPEPPEENRDEGKFGGEEKPMPTGKKGHQFHSFEDYYKSLQGGTGIPEKQLEAQEETNEHLEVLIDILGGDKGDPFAVAQ